MKAWLFVNFLGACLLLANVSISTAEQRNIRSLERKCKYLKFMIFVWTESVLFIAKSSVAELTC